MYVLSEELGKLVKGWQVYRVTIEENNGDTFVEGYFTMKAFDTYLEERNKERERLGELIESKDEFNFEPIEINY